MKKRKRQTNPKKLTTVSKTLVVDLPEDIITEILTCLPVKTLIKFRSVCKSWLCLFSNPKFIKTHLIKSSNNTKFSHHKLILNVVSKNNVDKLHSCLLRVRSNNLSIDNHSFAPLDFPLKVNHSWVSVVGTCNGLVCMYIHSGEVGILIWNPSTRKSKELPWDDKARSSFPLKFGFGYDQLNDDYKVVNIGGYDLICKDRVKIYSLKNNSWRPIRPCSHSNSILNGWGKYVNGVLYWAIGNFNIVLFDLGNETFGKLSPPYYDNSFISHLDLGNFDGCLFASCHVDILSMGKACIDIWVMEDYGASDSWVKYFTILFTSNMHFGEVYFPFYIFKSGAILLKSHNHLVVFKPCNHRFTYAKLGNMFTNGKGLQTTTYVESLISPNLDDCEESSQ